MPRGTPPPKVPRVPGAKRAATPLPGPRVGIAIRPVTVTPAAAPKAPKMPKAPKVP